MDTYRSNVSASSSDRKAASGAEPTSIAWRLTQCLGFLVAAWLLLPAATPVHLEGFTAQIQSLAMRLAEQGNIHSHDLSRPRITDFIFLTRAGVVDLLAAANLVFGYTGDLGLRILTMCSLALMLVATAAAAKRLAGVSFGIALLACVAVPGLVELGFYFNDNVVSAAFFSLALWAATWKRSYTADAVAAAAFAAALLCRVDAVLGAPLLLLFYLRDARPFKVLAGRLLWMAAVCLAVLALAAWANGASLLDGIRIARDFSISHLQDKGLFPGRDPILHFFAPVGAVLIVLGAALGWRRVPDGWSRWVWLAAFYGYPLLLLLYVLRSSLELRYFMPLLAVPIAVHAGQGLQAVVAWARGPDAGLRRRAWVIAVFALAVLALPPAKSMMRDGPRFFVGRLWVTPAWLEWQDSVHLTMNKAAQTVADLVREPSAVLVTTSWNDEFYLRLRLFEAGYHEVGVEKACRPLSHYRSGDRDLWHVRMDPQYALPPFKRQLATALTFFGAAQCPSVRSDAPVWISTIGPLRPESTANGIEQADFDDPPYTVLLQTPGARSLRPHPHMQYAVYAARPYTPPRWHTLESRATAYVREQARVSGDDPERMLDRYERSFGVAR